MAKEDAVSWHYKVEGLNSAIKGTYTVSHGISSEMEAHLDGCATLMFANVTGNIHVRTGRLRLSSRGETKVNSRRTQWRSTMTFGDKSASRRPGNVYYAVFEFHRNGVHPASGTPHNFFWDLPSLYPLVDEVIATAAEPME